MNNGSNGQNREWSMIYVLLLRLLEISLANIQSTGVNDPYVNQFQSGLVHFKNSWQTHLWPPKSRWGLKRRYKWKASQLQRTQQNFKELMGSFFKRLNQLSHWAEIFTAWIYNSQWQTCHTASVLAVEEPSRSKYHLWSINRSRTNLTNKWKTVFFCKILEQRWACF